MASWTLKQVIDVAVTIGISAEKAEEFYHHYNSQGWKFGNNLPIIELSSALVRWRNSNWRFKGKEKSVSFGRCCYRCGSSERYDGRTGVIWREKLSWCKVACYDKWVREGRPKYD